VLTQGAPQRVRTAGIATFGTAESAAGSTAVLFTEAAAQRLVARPGTFDAVAVVAQSGVTQTELVTRIAKVLRPGTEAITGTALTAENQANAASRLSFLTTFLLAFAFIALFVGAFIIFNTFSILVAQRTKQTALLRALGATRRQVLGSVVVEAAVVGLGAAAVGVVTGVGVAVGLERLMAGFGIDIPSHGLTITARTVIVSIGAGIISVAAAFGPARTAARVAPITALRDAVAFADQPSRRRLARGVTVTGLGLTAVGYGLYGHAANPLGPVGLGAATVFVGVAMLGPAAARPLARLLGAPLARLGVSGRLARDNAMRNPRRTATTAAALTIGVGLVGFITVFAASAKDSFAASVDHAFTGDYVIDSGSFGTGGLPTELTRRIALLPEVAVAAGQRQTVVAVNGTTHEIEGIDPATFPSVVDLHVTHGRLQDLDATSIAVADTLAADNQWTVGDTISVRFAQTGAKTLRVTAIYTDKIQARPLLLALPAYEANVADQYDTRIYVTTASGVAAPQARAALERATAGYPHRDRQHPHPIHHRPTPPGQPDPRAHLRATGLRRVHRPSRHRQHPRPVHPRTHPRTRPAPSHRHEPTPTPRRHPPRIDDHRPARHHPRTHHRNRLRLRPGARPRPQRDRHRPLHDPPAPLAVIAALAALAGVAAATIPARRAASLDILQAITTT
jgi:putative ABC transport system permease protein